MSVAPASRAAHAVLLDRHGPAILSAVMVPAFTGADGIAVTTPITITIDGDAIRTDPYVGLRQRDQVIRRAGNPCESGEGR
jgi:hypothetical protein